VDFTNSYETARDRDMKTELRELKIQFQCGNSSNGQYRPCNKTNASMQDIHDHLAKYLTISEGRSNKNLLRTCGSLVSSQINKLWPNCEKGFAIRC
jgi:hypothetical protein